MKSICKVENTNEFTWAFATVPFHYIWGSEGVPGTVEFDPTNTWTMSRLYVSTDKIIEVIVDAGVGKIFTVCTVPQERG